MRVPRQVPTRVETARSEATCPVPRRGRLRPQAPGILSDPSGVLLLMGQDPLFDPPAPALARRLHEELFGALPARLSSALEDPRVAAAVVPLLARGWRPAQLAARVGALPEPADPVPAVVAFLERLLERATPQEQWFRERADRDREREDRAALPSPASPEVAAHWAAQARKALRAPVRTGGRSAAPRASAPPCSGCSGPDGAFFVTRQVRLCEPCVALLGSGRARLAVTA